MPILNRAHEMQAEVAAWRRHLHSHPELLFDVHQTAAFVEEKLKGFGCDEVVTGIGRTGVVGVIKGNRGEGETLGFRADMDALPIEEMTGKDYASTVKGKMHACGHDGHTAMLLGAAQYLAETRNFAGTIVVIFQPAEEGGGGGDAMVKDGLMERFGIARVFGMHNMPTLPVGSFTIRPGAFFAATDEFRIRITGRGGHAAMPNMTIDPIMIGAQLVQAMQTIASRNVDPVSSIVVSVTQFHAGTSHNIIPEEAAVEGTVRTLSTENRKDRRGADQGARRQHRRRAWRDRRGDVPQGLSGDGQPRGRDRNRGRGRAARRRRECGDHGLPRPDGRRGFRLHDGGASRRDDPDRQWKFGQPAPPGL